MRKSIDRLDKHPIITNTHAQWSEVFTYVCRIVSINFGEYLIPLLAWKNHIVAIFGDFLNCGQNA